MEVDELRMKSLTEILVSNQANIKQIPFRRILVFYIRFNVQILLLLLYKLAVKNLYDKLHSRSPTSLIFDEFGILLPHKALK